MNDTFLPALELASISISGRNPRKTFDKAALEELSAAIAKVGVFSPVLVRSLPDQSLELVYGERRYRASQMAGQTTIPALLRHNLSDDDAFDIMIMENLDRRDVHPIEEAESFQLMLNSGRYSLADIAAKIAKDEKFVVQRLSLINLIDEIKQDFFHGELGIGHAVLIARLPEERQQEIKKGYSNNQVKGYGSISQLKHELSQDHLELEGSVFDISKDYTCALACTGCLKRTINQQLLFHDLQESDSCMDKACHRAKTSEHIEQKMLDIINKGENILFGANHYDVIPENIAALAKAYNYPILKEYNGFYETGNSTRAAAQLLYVGGSKRGLVKTVYVPVINPQSSSTPTTGVPQSGNAGELLRLRQRAVRDLELDEQKMHAAIKLALEEKMYGPAMHEFHFGQDFMEGMFLYLAVDTYSLWNLPTDFTKHGFTLKREYSNPEELVEDLLKLTPEQKKYLLARLLYKKTRDSIDGQALLGKIVRQLAYAGKIPVDHIEAPIRANAKLRIARSEDRIKALEQPKTTKAKA